MLCRVFFFFCFFFCSLPNRNSLTYAQLYDIPDADTVLRGTLRFKGFSRNMIGLTNAGAVVVSLVVSSWVY